MRSRTPVSGPGPEQGRVCDLCGPGGAWLLVATGMLVSVWLRTSHG